MAQEILIKAGTKAALDKTTLSIRELAFTTDTREVYVGDGSKAILVGRAMSGTYADRPNAGTEGRMYYVTSGSNAGYIYRDNGAAWEKVNAKALTDLTGTLDDIADGTSYKRVKAADITAGQVNKLSDGSSTVTAVQARAHIDDAAKHRVINDAGSAATELWSAQKIKNELELAKRGQEYQDSVKDKDLSAPPASPVAKDRYIVKATGTGAWAGKNNQIAEWTGSAWQFIAPTQGMTAIVDDESKQYTYNGTTWVRTGGALQTVTAGNGLTGGGTADTVTINVGAGNGIAVAADTVAAKAGNGITVNAAGINVNYDSVSIVKLANGTIAVGTVDGGTF